MKQIVRFASIALLSVASIVPLTAQLLGHGGAVGGVTGSATGAVGAGVNGAGPVNGAVQGEAGAAANVRAIGQATDVGAAIRENAALSSSLQPLLPEGVDMNAASAGFRNTTQFMTTLHTARNLNIPFSDLKAQTTGKGRVSLDKAVHQLRPDLDDKAVKSSLKLSEKQTDHDLVQASASVSANAATGNVSASGGADASAKAAGK
jgi:hypothetical protein